MADPVAAPAAPTPVVAAVQPPLPAAAPAAVEKPGAPPAAAPVAPAAGSVAQPSAIEPAAPTPADAPAPSLLGDAKGEAAPPAEAAPTKYEAFKFPETFKPDDAIVGQFTEVLGKHKAPQELGQALIDFHVQEVGKIVQAQTEGWNNLNKQWQDTVRADAEIGGDRLPGNLTKIARMLDEFGTPELREALNVTGAGNHPAVVRFMLKAAAALTEGGRPVPAPSGPAPVAKSSNEKRYPTLFGGKPAKTGT